MRSVAAVVLVLMFSVAAMPQRWTSGIYPFPAGMSAKTAKAMIDAKVAAKVATVDVVDGIALRLAEARVFLAYDNCERGWKKHWLRNWWGSRYDPCKAELRHIALSFE